MESEPTAQTDTIEPNEQEQQKVAEVVLQTEVVVEESALETNSLEVQEKSEQATPVKVENDAGLTNNLPAEATVEAKEIIPLAPPVTEQTTTTTESSDLTSEHTIEDVVENSESKQTETKEQPSTEISNDDTPAADVEVIVENGSVASVPASEPTTEHLDVPNENESTESLTTPSEESKNATERTESKLIQHTQRQCCTLPFSITNPN